MADTAPHCSPAEMFSILKSTTTGVGPRLGRLALGERKAIETPHYLANTSRGAVPHLTQDVFRRHTDIHGVYVALEDFIERAPREIPPVYKFRPADGGSPLRRFIALHDESLLVLGARRAPPVIAPAANPNTNTTVSVCTSVGFRLLQASDFGRASEDLQPDIVIALGDIPYGRALGSKRVEKATDRSLAWLQEHIALRRAAGDAPNRGKLFASLLPVSSAKQHDYTEYLLEQVAGNEVDGLALHSLDGLDDLPEALQALPRLGFAAPHTPQEALQQVSRGLDMLTLSFVGAASDAGIALDFEFPPPQGSSGPDAEAAALRPLGVDMWAAAHAVDASPLAAHCACYACANHHRAYVRHLLTAKEMLAWTLLQIHNHRVADAFFTGIRQSLERDTFEADVRDFERTYAAQLPEKTGQGPRTRGYEAKVEGPGELKRNPAPFTMLDDGKEKLAEARSTDAPAVDVQNRGFADKQ